MVVPNLIIQPQLKQINTGIYQCSACDFKILMNRPRALSGKEWTERLENRLAMHMVESHKQLEHKRSA